MTTIVHTTDLSGDDQRAFVHGVALARAAKAKLVCLRANAPSEAASKMPEAGELLSKWGADPQSVPFSRTVHNCCDDPVDTVLDGIKKIQPDLVVAATHRRSALARFFTGSAAEAIAHNVEAPTLLLPEGARGFASSEDGRLDLHRIMVPIGDPEAAAVAIRTAAWLADLCDDDEVEFVLLHVGDPIDVDDEPLRARPGWTVERTNLPTGDVEDAILSSARDACLVVMATRGHDSVRDVVRGSHTDRVLHDTKCPVLSVGVQS